MKNHEDLIFRHQVYYYRGKGDAAIPTQVPLLQSTEDDNRQDQKHRQGKFVLPFQSTTLLSICYTSQGETNSAAFLSSARFFTSSGLVLFHSAPSDTTKASADKTMHQMNAASSPLMYAFTTVL